VSQLREHWEQLPVSTRRCVAAVIGGLLLIAGLAMMVLPGPGLMVVAVALVILGTEFEWPRRVLQSVRRRLRGRRLPRA
jgi:Putative transmembrane protein (PGPGW)